MPFITDDTISFVPTSECLPSLSPSRAQGHLFDLDFIGKTLGGLANHAPLPVHLSQLQTRHRDKPDRDKNTFMLLPKLGWNMWLAPASPPSLYLETYLSHNEVYRVNSHAASHKDEDSAPLCCPSQHAQGQAQGFFWLA